MIVDIICPLYNAEKYIENLHKSFEMQQDVQIGNIRYVITKGNDNTEEKVKKLKCIYRIIEPKDFSHSLVREKEAFESNADIVVFVTQDIIIERKDWLKKLIEPIEKNEAEACYSRQICANNSMEKYTREKNYPDKSSIVSKEDIPKLGLRAFFFSDASSAIKRDIFVELNGYDFTDMPISEDMYIAYKLITGGYKIKYCAESEVIHSHDFTLKEQYKRYYETGKFFKQNAYLNRYKVNSTGGKLAFYILKRAVEEKNWKVIMKWLPNMGARFLGMKLGKLSKDK